MERVGKLRVYYSNNNYEEVDKGVIVGVYSRAGNKISNLTLKRRHHWVEWEFPRGHKSF